MRTPVERANILCPGCGGPTHVVDCRGSGRPVHSVRRRRECLGCDHRFTTHEIIADLFFDKILARIQRGLARGFFR